MITLTIGELFGLNILFTIIWLILYNSITYFFIKRPKITKYRYIIKSKITGYKYHCYAIRENGYILECYIWNPYSNSYTWYPMSHFVICYEICKKE